MVLNRIMRNVRLNWTYAIGEIILVFVGITLSLVFDQWRTTKASTEKEKQLLVILRQSIQKDINNLKYNIDECKTTLKMRQYLVDKLPLSNAMTDSLSRSFSWIASNPWYKPDMTGYKTIELQGCSVFPTNNSGL